MADDNKAEAQAAAATSDVVGDSYEVIRRRLIEQGRALGERAGALNEQRKQVFGSTEFQVLASTRVRTENNCVPADITPVGGQLLFGYNVFIGLKQETAVGDVFGVHAFAEEDGSPAFVAVGDGAAARGFLEDRRFVADFHELYRYYKAARLTKLSRADGKLLAVFRFNDNPKDLRVFRWALDTEGKPTYLDNRGDRDYRLPAQHDFEWVETGKDDHVGGRHPHVNVLDTVFVETVGGTLNVKIENNTEDGEGIFSEPVDDPRQALDDADIRYAKVGTLILLAVRPFNEPRARHLVYATRPKKVVRIDAIGDACVQLPEDHGIIFPGGYFLQDGQYKVFDGNFAGLEYERSLRAPNGEDVLYVFHRGSDGLYVLLTYNLIEKRVQNPILCHGYSLFEDGRLVVFRASSDEPTRVHPMQIWKTPFVSDLFAAKAPPPAGPLGKIGNRELVRGISDAFALKRMIEDGAPSRQIYEDLIAAVVRTMDAHHFLVTEVGRDLLPLLRDIKATAELVVDEFDKVEAFRMRADKALADARREQEELQRRLRPDIWQEVDPFMEALTALRSRRGHLISLKEIRYIDQPAVDAMERACAESFDLISRAAVQFLLKDQAFAPLARQIETLLGEVPRIEKSRELEPANQRAAAIADGLTVLSDVVSGLEVDDPTARTAILERISEVFAGLNRLRATLEAQRRKLMRGEGQAAFAAQFKLFGQSVTSALALAATPDACDDQLSKLMVAIEELEARFSEFDEYLGQLADKREEVYQSFTQRKQQLLDERQRQAQNLFGAGERILVGVGRRAQGFKNEDDLNGYFASDPMILKLRELAERLLGIGDATRGDELLSRLKTARQDALRGLRDRSELFEDGDNIIKFGKHRFTVNTQALQLTLVPHDDGMALNLTGTDFREAVADPTFVETRPFWEQHLPSETPAVYRGEYLAYCLLHDAEIGRDGASLAALVAARATPEGLPGLVRRVAAERYEEGYERGLHDADASAILDRLLDLHGGAGLLRFAPRVRALATLFWAQGPDGPERRGWQRQAQSFGRLRGAFAAGGDRAGHEALTGALTTAITAFAANLQSASDEAASAAAARYLIDELSQPQPQFVASHEAVALRDGLRAHLERAGMRAALEDDLKGLADDPGGRLAVARAWLRAYIEVDGRDAAHAGAFTNDFAEEAAALLLTDGRLERRESSARTMATVEGLLGNHPRIEDGKLSLCLFEFLTRLEHFVRVRAPGFRAYRKLRQELLDRERHRLRLDEFTPRVLSSFVRNRLINESYLPLIGDNLAKQLGAAGEKKRTDLMGLLLLISPPGYGKTTLMEYVANRLGLVFMKVNGPALGHDVRSLDPADAPNATARQEVEKVNLALEMGNNVMLYLDDIQHTHPELLQKFISLCDAQRRIEGVWRGRTRTYDLRGKKFCVVMAGNPYTESGEKFQIPDMLANRADVYNLGDVLSGREEVFALSYVENAITSNATLAPLATRDQQDIHTFLRMAAGGEVGASDLKHEYSAVEMGEIVAVLKRLFKAQQLLLKVNQAYIASASMDDRFRVEPPFKLQGSYRNMNKLAEKIVAAMTDEELDRLFHDHYVGEAQTLTTGAEHNMLKLAELRGTMTAEQTQRWGDIKREFQRVKSLGGKEDDPVTRVTGQLSVLGTRLDAIRVALADTTAANGARAETAAARERAELERRLVEAQAQLQQAAHDRQLLALRDDSERTDGQAPPWVRELLIRLERIIKVTEKRKIEVKLQSAAPPELAQLLGQQVALVEQALIPLVQQVSAAAGRGGGPGLDRRLDELVTAIQNLDLWVRGPRGDV